MTGPVNVFILGSCVSRDPFEFADGRDFNIAAYFARSSFASLDSKPFVDERILANIESKFQKRVVKADMDKSVFHELKERAYDLLLIDLIDERFGLSLSKESVHTVSSEYKKALYKPNDYKIIRSFTSEKRELWLKGLTKIKSFLEANSLDTKLVINKVYWSLNSGNSQRVSCLYSEEFVCSVNHELEWMYQSISRLLPRSRFIEYRPNELEIDEEHKWGMQPFHYSRVAFSRQLKTLYSLSLRSIEFTIKHPLGDHTMSFPVNWSIDPFRNRAWQHNLCSLRWLNSSHSFLFKLFLLQSFYKYHCVQKRNNSFYNTIKGDHTASIRLSVFSVLKSLNDNDPYFSALISKLIHEEIRNLQDSRMYRAGHNHGLMVDISLLRLMLVHPDLGNLIDLSYVLERSSKTIASLWDANGMTKEHSVSYQEYNLPLTIEYYDILSNLHVKPMGWTGLNSIKSTSQKFLGYALRGNGEYFALGDSFRLPNINILKKVFSGNAVAQDSPHGLLAPYSQDHGCFLANGFFLYRKIINNAKVHFAATCSWNSHCHKQDDELSFCFELDGILIFDDPGYTEFSEWNTVLKLKSQDVHSTICLQDESWIDRTETNHSSILSGKETTDGFIVNMSTIRCPGIKYNRDVHLNREGLFVNDSVVSATTGDLPLAGAGRTVITTFVLSQNILFKYNSLSDPPNTIGFHDSSGRLLCSMRFPKECKLDGHKLIPYVSHDRKIVAETTALFFSSTSTNQSQYHVYWNHA